MHSANPALISLPSTTLLLLCQKKKAIHLWKVKLFIPKTWKKQLNKQSKTCFERCSLRFCQNAWFLVLFYTFPSFKCYVNLLHLSLVWSYSIEWDTHYLSPYPPILFLPKSGFPLYYSCVVAGSVFFEAEAPPAALVCSVQHRRVRNWIAFQSSNKMYSGRIKEVIIQNDLK